MTEAEQYNMTAFAEFKKSEAWKTHKIFVILSSDQEGKTKVFQSPIFSPKQIAEKLFRIANQIISALNNPQKPN